MNLRYASRYFLATVFGVLLMANTAALAQIDAPDNNNNGIWDYIDEYIDTNYPDPSDMRSAVQQYATALQKALVETDNPDAALNNVTAFYRSMDCLFYVAGEDGFSISSELEAVIVNTPERSNAYLMLSDQMAGQVTKESRLSEYSKSCQN